MDRIAMVAAKRTPTGNFNGVFVDTPAPQLGAAAIHAALQTLPSSFPAIDQVYLGCVLAAGMGQAPARQAALAAQLSVQTPCVTVNKMCGSAMQTVIMAHDALMAGSCQAIVAGGMENMSRAPYLLNKARQGYRLGHQTVYDHMLLDGLEDAYEPGRHMGYFAEKCAAKFNITREQQDSFAIASIERARKAIENGEFNNEIAPVTITKKKQSVIITSDEGPFSVNPGKIPQLLPVFIENGTITAANASSIADGAAVLILTRESIAKKAGIKPLAYICAHHTYAQEPEWYTTAPISAIEGLMKKLNWTLEQVDLFEINEAFAVVTLVAMKMLKLDHQRVNVNGGGCILGHPIGASGARIIVTLINALRHRQLRRGVAALCIGGGEATAVAIETAYD